MLQKDRLMALIEPIVVALGYELVLLEYSPAHGAGILRVYIDSDAGITLDDCQRVSREVSGVMDVEDPIHGAYRLEISSPGLDRPLVKPQHFERFKGQQAKVQLLVPHGASKRKRFTGEIVSVAAGVLTLGTPDGVVELELSEIERARLVPDYEREHAGS
jgi:ribosome maturation factor RimP